MAAAECPIGIDFAAGCREIDLRAPCASAARRVRFGRHFLTGGKDARVLHSRFARFSLRALLLAVTGCCIALAVWRMPFETDVKDRSEFAYCPMGMSGEQMDEASRRIDAIREIGRVYRDFHGNHIKHGLAVLYNENGVKIRERTWVHGQLEGTETNWAPAARLHSRHATVAASATAGRIMSKSDT